MAEHVSILHPNDTTFFDEDTLNALSRDLGPNVAENILCRALEDLATRFSRIRDQYGAGDERALRKTVRSVIPIAKQVGLPDLAMICDDVLICLDRREGVAIAATLCRLLRSGEYAMSCADFGIDLSV